MHDRFRIFARATAEAVGSPWAFSLALAATGIWAAFGPSLHYSDSWQLTINTGTTICTFLMVFLIQYTQNRDARVIHLKLDELIRAVSSARTELVNMEALSDEDLDRLQREFEKLKDQAALAVDKIAQKRYSGKRPAPQMNGK
jgi:low affinity Fe/Cu permease